jgi:hypothetical protein
MLAALTTVALVSEGEEAYLATNFPHSKLVPFHTKGSTWEGSLQRAWFIKTLLFPSKLLSYFALKGGERGDASVAKGASAASLESVSLSQLK